MNAREIRAPQTYLVDALRALMVHGEPSAAGLPADFALLALAARLYPSLAE